MLPSKKKTTNFSPLGNPLRTRPKRRWRADNVCEEPVKMVTLVVLYIVYIVWNVWNANIQWICPLIDEEMLEVAM